MVRQRSSLSSHPCPARPIFPASARRLLPSQLTPRRRNHKATGGRNPSQGPEVLAPFLDELSPAARSVLQEPQVDRLKVAILLLSEERRLAQMQAARSDERSSMLQLTARYMRLAGHVGLRGLLEYGESMYAAPRDCLPPNLRAEIARAQGDRTASQAVKDKARKLPARHRRWAYIMEQLPELSACIAANTSWPASKSQNGPTVASEAASDSVDSGTYLDDSIQE